MANWWDDSEFFKGTSLDPSKSKPKSAWQSFMDAVTNRDWGQTADVISEAAQTGLESGIGFLGDAANAIVPITQPGRILDPNVRGVFQNILTGATPSMTEAMSGSHHQVVGGSAPEPQDTFDKYAGAATEGVTASMVGAPEVASAKALKSLILAGIGGGVGSQAASDLFPGNPAAQQIGMFLGGAAGGVIPHTRDIHTAMRVRDGASNPDFTRAIAITAETESGGRENAVSPKGAKGSMQVMDATAANPGHGIAPAKNLADRARVGRQLFAVLLSKYDHDFEKAWAAYNWGEGNLDKAIKAHGDDWYSHAPAETQNYVATNMVKLGRGGAVGEAVPPMNPADIAMAMGDEGMQQATRPEIEIPETITPDEVDFGGDTDLQHMAEQGRVIKEKYDALTKDFEEGRVSQKEFNDRANELQAFEDDRIRRLEEHQRNQKVVEFPQQERPPVREEGPLGTVGAEHLTAAERQEMDASVPKPEVTQSVQLEEPKVVEAANDQAAPAIDTRSLKDRVAEKGPFVTQANFASAMKEAKAQMDHDNLAKAAQDAQEALDSFVADFEQPKDKRTNAYKQWNKSHKALTEQAQITKDKLTEMFPDGRPADAPRTRPELASAGQPEQTGNKEGTGEPVFKGEEKRPRSPKAIGGGPSQAAFGVGSGGSAGGGGKGGKGGGGGKEPPSGGGDEGKFAGSINLNRLDISDSAKDRIRGMAKDRDVTTQSHEETKQRAAELIDEHGVEGLLRLDKVRPEDLPAYNTAIRAIHAELQERAVQLSDLFLNGHDDSLTKARLDDTIVLAALAFDRVNGRAASLPGRILDAQKIVVGNEHLTDFSNVREMLDNRISTEDAAKKILENKEKASKVAADSLKPQAEEYFFSVWYSMLLSSPKTLMRNVISNLLMQTYENLVVHPVAAAIGLTHGGEKFTAREGVARVLGTAQGMVEGFKNAPEAYRQGTPADQVERTQSYWKPPNKGIGRVVGVPHRVLSAQDEVFRSMGALGDYFGMAHRIAAREGLTGDAYRDRVQELLDNPTKEMNASATEAGQRLRFQDPMEWKGWEAMTRSHKGDSAVVRVAKGMMRVLIPFPRNADRMFFGALRYSPLGMVEPKNIRDFKAGGARRDIAIARVTTGIALAGSLYMWAANGGITGGPPNNPSARAQWLKTHQPYSLNFGDTHISFRGVADPFSTILGSVADAVQESHEKADDLGDKIMQTGVALAGLISDSTWGEGLSQFFKALEDKTGHTAENWMGRMASGFVVPTIVRNVNQDYVDPTLRDVTDHPVLQSIQAAVPGASKSLPARNDAYGDVITRENPAYLNIINPASVKHTNDSFAKDMDKLGESIVTNPSRTVNGQKLKAKDYQQYVKLAGQNFRSNMKDVMDDFDWDFMTDAEKKDKAKKVLSQSRKQARDELFPKDDDWNF
jgi:hypothetical protein